MTACREPHDSNVVRLQAPLLCVLAHEPNGALRILERNVGRLRMSPNRKPVGQDEDRDTILGQPVPHLHAFLVDHHALVGTSGHDNDRCPIRSLRLPDLKGWSGHAKDGAILHGWILAALDHLLFGARALGAWSRSRPDRYLLGATRPRRRRSRCQTRG